MCDKPAIYRYTWPGKDESVICKDHLGKLLSVANAMGVYLQIIQLSDEDLKVELICKQKETK